MQKDKKQRLNKTGAENNLRKKNVNILLLKQTVFDPVFNNIST